jgi:plastocyanin
MCSWTGSGSLISAAVLIAVAAGCSDDSGPAPEEPLVIQRAPTSSGNGQTGDVGGELSSALRVVITRASEPESEVDVDWATGNGGSLAPATSTTDADGVATTTWTLGPQPGTQTATATVDGADGSPVSFTATAEDVSPPPPPPPPATIQVLGPDGGNRFEPTQVTIQVGQAVEWVWPAGTLDHNVVPDEEDPTTSGPPADGPTEYSFTFTTAGTYDFYCITHGGPGGFGMSGTVIVTPEP